MPALSTFSGTIGGNQGSIPERDPEKRIPHPRKEFIHFSHIATNTTSLNTHFLPSDLKREIKVLKNDSKHGAFMTNLYKQLNL